MFKADLRQGRAMMVCMLIPNYHRMQYTPEKRGESSCNPERPTLILLIQLSREPHQSSHLTFNKKQEKGNFPNIEPLVIV